MSKGLYRICLRAVWMHFLVFHRSFWCSSVFWSMWASGLCLNCSSFLGDKLFSLSLTVFGGWIGWDFALLGGVVCVWVVDSVCCRLDYLTLDFSSFLILLSLCLLKFSQVYFFPRWSWNFGQSFGSNWILFSTRALYSFSWLIGSTLHATEACFLQ